VHLAAARSARQRAYRARKHEAGKYAHRSIKGGIGHNLPHEAPQAFARAIVDVGKN
jgi:pimeloyl-ACP methyl ester carboxylesterase